jgi:septal ring factor EnvC (AmiA/AmiB activator)
LTLSSIFLCGIVVTYVSNAENHREKVDDLTRQRDAAVRQRESADEKLKQKTEDYQAAEDRLNAQVASLTTEISTLNSKTDILQIDKKNLEEKVQSWVALTDSLTKTNEEQGLLLTNTLEELKQVKSAQMKQRDQLDDVTKELMEKVAVIETINKEKRLLEEERSQLRKQLDQYQLRLGRETAPAAIVTPEPPPTPAIEPAPSLTPLTPAPGAREIGLKGVITVIDSKNSLTEISIGSANGVREGMRFFVTRSDQFICEILVFYVDAEKSVGIIEPDRMRYQPKVGDHVSTNL